MNQNAVIVFQKNAELGKVKTRLAATLGDQQALDIYRHLIDKTYSQLSGISDADIFVYFSEFHEKSSLKIPHQTAVQKGVDLGERMKCAFEEVFAKGYERVILIGTDCPDIETNILNQALKELLNNDAVFGPALDGGYYLIGLKEVYSELFENIPWSTDKVLLLTEKQLNKKKLTYSLLKPLRDIDTPDDWESYLSSKSRTTYQNG